MGEKGLNQIGLERSGTEQNDEWWVLLKNVSHHRNDHDHDDDHHHYHWGCSHRCSNFPIM